MKKLFSLLLVVAMLASMAVVVSAATENVMKTTITETAEGINVVVTISNPNNVSGALASLSFPSTLSCDKTQYTLGADFAGLTVSGSSKTGNVKYSFSHGSAADFVTATGDVVTISFPLYRAAGDETVYTSADFAYGTGLYAAQLVYNDGSKSVTMKNTNTAYAANFAAPVYVDARTPAVEEPTFNATKDGTTITCTGKVDATVENYGVVFTAESTLEGARPQKYYGAMDGDTVKDYKGSTTFTYGDWDGTFEIILEGVHAGTKVLNFFANDTIIPEADTFTLTIAE